MTWDRDIEFIERLTATVREAARTAPDSLGAHEAQLMHGTTIGAFKIENGARALAFSDGKVSMGNKPVHLSYRKILTIDRYTRMLISGSPVIGKAHGAALKSYIGFREDTSGQLLSARAKVKFLSRLLVGQLGLLKAGIICAPILVTFDVRGKKAARIFSLGPDGSEIEHAECAAGGSGESVSLLLKDTWRSTMTLDEGIALARKLILSTAPENDSFSGGRLSLDLIGPDGARTVS